VVLAAAAIQSGAESVFPTLVGVVPLPELREIAKGIPVFPTLVGVVRTPTGFIAGGFLVFPTLVGVVL